MTDNDPAFEEVAIALETFDNAEVVVELLFDLYFEVNPYGYEVIEFIVKRLQLLRKQNQDFFDESRMDLLRRLERPDFVVTTAE